MTSKRPLFHPSFGSRPGQIIGRDELLESYLNGLSTPVGSPERCTFFRGQRGMGKTSLLLEISERAPERDFVVARVTAYEDLCREIIEEIQRNGQEFIREKKRSVSGITAGAMGISFGLTFSKEAEEQYGFRSKLTLLCDKLEEYGKGVLILVDEAVTSKAMRELAVTYQQLVGEDRNIAIAMAGLPQAVSSVLNDGILTFLNRSNKVDLGPIDVMDIQLYFMNALEKSKIRCKDDVLNKAAIQTKGFPYLFQLVGYYMLKMVDEGSELTEEKLDHVLDFAKKDMEQNVFRPILDPLSERDMQFLTQVAKAGEEARTQDVAKALDWSNSMIQPYRARAVAAGIVESPCKGKLVFVVPFLREYLASK